MVDFRRISDVFPRRIGLNVDVLALWNVSTADVLYGSSSVRKNGRTKLPRHLERLDAPIFGAVQRPLAADRLHRWSCGNGKRDVHLVDDALEAWTVILAARCSDRHLSARPSLAQHKSQPIQLCLSGLSPGKDAEVDNDAPVLGKHYGQLIAIRH